MICELFPFQKQAVNEMRLRVAMALNNYRMLKIPQVVSLQAPTGSGKTIIMSALIEDIFYGSEQFTEQPEAIFVWLSDSPQLNEQSKQKIELKADKIRMDQCVVISDESFDREILEDGHIYFLNTQKLGKAGNLSRHSDTRQYTIWETIENTAREKADRLYFIIDEAHRGMQGRQAGTATTIMQRFIKGSSEQNLLPIPVVIGMSATAERFNSLVGQATNSTLHKVIISPAQVRQSGLLKDRIVITYPEDPIKHGDMAVLQAATDEWQDKCKHWYQYTYEQHYQLSSFVEKEDASLNFFMTMIIPLLIDDVGTIQGAVTFLIIVVMMCALLSKTHLYYANSLLDELEMRWEDEQKLNGLSSVHSMGFRQFIFYLAHKVDFIAEIFLCTMILFGNVGAQPAASFLLKFASFAFPFFFFLSHYKQERKVKGCRNKHFVDLQQLQASLEKQWGVF